MDVFTNWWSGETGEKIPSDKPESKNEEPAEQKTIKSTEEEDQNVAKDVENSKPVEEAENAESQIDGIVHDFEDVSKKAYSAAMEWGGYLFDVASKTTKTVADSVVDTATSVKHVVEEHSILGDFNKEQDKFVEEKRSKRSEAAVPPWIGYQEEEQMKKQILSLSQDKRNFLRNPPPGVPFAFDYQTSYPVAMATLKEDPNLEKMRFDLVPKNINEENFWRNYFYRVSLIKQSSQLTTLAQQTGSTGECRASSAPSKDTGSLPREIPTKPSLSEDSPPDSPAAAEFVSDAFAGPVNAEEIKNGMKQLGMDDKKENEEDVAEWEKELQKELQEYEVVDDENSDPQLEKEIQDMLEAEEAQTE